MLHRKGAIHLQNSTQNIVFSGYVVEKRLKESDRGRVFLVREEDSRTRYIYRTFCGSGEVYKRMLSIDCRYLPGCVSIVYEPVREDTWLYDISACLDGVELTARATTSFYIRE